MLLIISEDNYWTAVAQNHGIKILRPKHHDIEIPRQKHQQKFYYSKRIWHSGERTRRNIISFIINRKLNPKSSVVSDNLLNCNRAPLFNHFCGLRAKTFLLEQQNCDNTERQNIFKPFMYNVVKWSNILKNYRKILKVCLTILQHYAWEG